MDCKNKKANEKKCACPHDDCERHAVCCECVANHRADGSLPMCLRGK